MPNTFAPKAIEGVVKDVTKRLRMEYEGEAADVKEWHAIVHIMDDEHTEQFLENYGNRVSNVPYVVDGIDVEDGRVPDDMERSELE